MPVRTIAESSKSAECTPGPVADSKKMTSESGEVSMSKQQQQTTPSRSLQGDSLRDTKSTPVSISNQRDKVSQRKNSASSNSGNSFHQRGNRQRQSQQATPAEPTPAIIPSLMNSTTDTSSNGSVAAAPTPSSNKLPSFSSIVAAGVSSSRTSSASPSATTSPASSKEILVPNNDGIKHDPSSVILDEKQIQPTQLATASNSLKEANTTNCTKGTSVNEPSINKEQDSDVTQPSQTISTTASTTHRKFALGSSQKQRHLPKQQSPQQSQTGEGEIDKEQSFAPSHVPLDHSSTLNQQAHSRSPQRRAHLVIPGQGGGSAPVHVGQQPFLYQGVTNPTAPPPPAFYPPQSQPTGNTSSLPPPPYQSYPAIPIPPHMLMGGGRNPMLAGAPPGSLFVPGAPGPFMFNAPGFSPSQTGRFPQQPLYPFPPMQPSLAHMPQSTSALTSNPEIFKPATSKIVVKIVDPKSGEQLKLDKKSSSTTMVDTSAPTVTTAEVDTTSNASSGVEIMPALAIEGEKKREVPTLVIDVEEDDTPAVDFMASADLTSPVTTAQYVLQVGDDFVNYPEDDLVFFPPSSEQDPWKYSRQFLLAFKDVCNRVNMETRQLLKEAMLSGKEAYYQKRRSGSAQLMINATGASTSSRQRGSKGSASSPIAAYAASKRYASEIPTWTPGASLRAMDKVGRRVAEIRSILNKMTLDTFERLSEQIIDLLEVKKVDLEAVMEEAAAAEADETTHASSSSLTPAERISLRSAVIELIFDKAVEEPQFCAMYAQLCYRIVAVDWQATERFINSLPSEEDRKSIKLGSEFRISLISKCQHEYENKRAWSKRRLEQLAKKDNTETSPATETAATAGEIILTDSKKRPEDIGFLTEEEMAMIKTKKRVLGNIRFIGQLFQARLIRDQIMHKCIRELVSNYKNPEEEEVECLCKLLMTVGKDLDPPSKTPEQRDLWSKYMEGLKALVDPRSGLSTRVRFQVMDVLELREKGWGAAVATPAHQPPTRLTPTPRSTASSFSTSRPPPTQILSRDSRAHDSKVPHDSKSQLATIQQPVIPHSPSSWSNAVSTTSSNTATSSASTNPSHSIQPTSTTPVPKHFSTGGTGGVTSKTATQVPSGSTQWRNIAAKREEARVGRSASANVPVSSLPLTTNTMPRNGDECDTKNNEILVVQSAQSQIDLKRQFLKMETFDEQEEKVIKEVLTQACKPETLLNLLNAAVERNSRADAEKLINVFSQVFPKDQNEIVRVAIQEFLAGLDELVIDAPMSCMFAACFMTKYGINDITNTLPRSLDEHTPLVSLKTLLWTAIFNNDSSFIDRKRIFDLVSLILNKNKGTIKNAFYPLKQMMSEFSKFAPAEQALVKVILLMPILKALIEIDSKQGTDALTDVDFWTDVADSGVLIDFGFPISQSTFKQSAQEIVQDNVHLFLDTLVKTHLVSF